MSEAHEFIGKDRAEAVAKATAYFGAGENELAIAEADTTKVSGLGTRLAIVARLGQPVGNVIDDVEARHILQCQQIRGVRMLFAEDRHQHVGDGDLFLAARLHVEHGALQHALEAQRRLHLAVVVLLEPGRGLLDELGEFLAQAGRIGSAGAQDLAHFRRVDDGEQQVLDRHEFVACLPGRLESVVQADLEFAAQHGFRPLPSCKGVDVGAAGRRS